VLKGIRGAPPKAMPETATAAPFILTDNRRAGCDLRYVVALRNAHRPAGMENSLIV